MIEIEIPKDRDKVKKQIQALEWQIEQDTNEKDKEIHTKTLKALKLALNGK